METVTYKSKNLAKRAADKQGLTAYELVQQDKLWHIICENKDEQPEPSENAKASDGEDSPIVHADPSLEPTAVEQAAVQAKAIDHINRGEIVEAVHALETLLPKRRRSSGGPTYKELERTSLARSTVLKPVEVVWKFLDANPMIARKDAIIELGKMGVNYSTAHTQYQRWRKKNEQGHDEAPTPATEETASE